jgi:hypothetical protein
LSQSTSFPRRRESKFVAPPVIDEVHDCAAKIGFPPFAGTTGHVQHLTVNELLFKRFEGALPSPIKEVGSGRDATLWIGVILYFTVTGITEWKERA